MLKRQQNGYHLLVVPKPIGNMCLCVDYTQMNKVVRREVYPMYHVQASLAKLGQGEVFTKIDVNSWLYQIPYSKMLNWYPPFLRRLAVLPSTGCHSVLPHALKPIAK